MKYRPDTRMVKYMPGKSITDRLNVQLTQDNDFLCRTGTYETLLQLWKNQNKIANLRNAEKLPIPYHERDPMRFSNTRVHARRSMLLGIDYLGETTEISWYTTRYGLSYFHKTGHFFVDGSPGSLIERAQDRAKINPRI